MYCSQTFLLYRETSILERIKKVKISGSDVRNLRTAGNSFDIIVALGYMACECHADDLGYIAGLPVYTTLLSCHFSE